MKSKNLSKVAEIISKTKVRIHLLLKHYGVSISNICTLLFFILIHNIRNHKFQRKFKHTLYLTYVLLVKY